MCNFFTRFFWPEQLCNSSLSTSRLLFLTISLARFSHYFCTHCHYSHSHTIVFVFLCIYISFLPFLVHILVSKGEGWVWKYVWLVMSSPYLSWFILWGGGYYVVCNQGKHMQSLCVSWLWAFSNCIHIQYNCITKKVLVAVIKMCNFSYVCS